MARIAMDGYKCERCGHEWPPKSKGQEPRVCPKCKSPYWDRPRRANKQESLIKKSQSKGAGGSHVPR